MHWSVITPFYTSYFYDEPPEEGCDWVWVEADTKREAKVRAVQEWRKQNTHWIQDTRSDGVSPFKGLEVKSAECEHGFCWCELHDCIQKNPDWVFEDICPMCDENEKQNCVHEMYTGFLKKGQEKEATIQEYCNLCMQTREEINARENQQFNTGPSILTI